MTMRMGHPTPLPPCSLVPSSPLVTSLPKTKTVPAEPPLTRREVWGLVMAGLCLRDGDTQVQPRKVLTAKQSLALVSPEMSKVDGWFRKFIREDERGCWIWNGARFRGGYGAVGWQGTSRCAHRVIWELMVGDLPRALDLDHLCRVRACVNPEHLEPVTRSMNLMRGAHPTQGRLGRAGAA